MVCVMLVVYLPGNRENKMAKCQVELALDKLLNHFNSLTWGKHFRPLTSVTVQFGTCLIEICLNMRCVVFLFFFPFHIEQEKY